MIQINKILSSVPIFRSLSKDNIDFIVERLKFKTFDKDETVCKIGDPGDTMYIIISGEVKICIYDGNNNEQVVARLKSGDYFGEMALFTGEPRSASVITTQGAEMFLLYKSDFDDILDRFPAISLSMAKIGSKRLRETLSKAITLPKATAGKAVDGPSGSIKDQPVIELIAFCDTNSLTGTLTLTKNGDQGFIEYQKGEMISITLGDLKDDKALDELMTWEDGKYAIKVKPLKIDSQKEEKEEEPKKILIVNNSLVVRKLIERAFKGLGYIVNSVQTIKESKESITKDVPDIIISDLKLSDGDGIDLCESVKSQHDCSFIFMSDESIKPETEEKIKKLDKTEITKTHEVSEFVKIVENMI